MPSTGQPSPPRPNTPPPAIREKAVELAQQLGLGPETHEALAWGLYRAAREVSSSVRERCARECLVRLGEHVLALTANKGKSLENQLARTARLIASGEAKTLERLIRLVPLFPNTTPTASTHEPHP